MGILNKSTESWYSIKEILLLFARLELNKLWLKSMKIDRIIELLKYRYIKDEHDKLHREDVYFFEYYTWRVFLQDEVNIYIFGNDVEIATIDEFLMSEIVSIPKHYIKLSLNHLLSLLYKREELNNTNTTLLSITEDEKEVIEQMRLNEKKLDIHLSYKDWIILEEMKIKEPLTKEKVANSKDFWTFEDLNFHRWKISSWKVVKKKRFDRE